MLPENLTITHIAGAMGVEEEDIFALTQNPRLAYAPAKRRPAGPKMRLITAPRRAWKRQYQWLALFLRREFPAHAAAHGSVPSRSPFTAASKHLGTRHLLSWDIKDAFPSITSDRFYLQLLAIGFLPDTARVLTALLLPDGYIPQGGPTSNAATDLFFLRTDAQIQSQLSRFGARYTRFTDGLDVSFRNASRFNNVCLILDRELRSLGLRLNLKKLEAQGWQPVGMERTVCGVRVNSPRGTQLPKAVIRKLITECESLHRGACTVAPHTLVGLAKRRRSVQGWLNQASQADISPISDLQRRLHQVDVLVQTALSRAKICPNHKWYIVGSHINEPASLARQWRRARLILARHVA